MVDVDCTLYSRNHVDLRRAERSAQFNHQEAARKESSQGSVASNGETAIREGDTSDIIEYVPEQIQERRQQVSDRPTQFGTPIITRSIDRLTHQECSFLMHSINLV